MGAPIVDARSISESSTRNASASRWTVSALCRRSNGRSAIRNSARPSSGRSRICSRSPGIPAEADIGEMLRIVHAVEAATRLPGYREAALSWAPEIARQDFGPRGVFMGYDFHLAADGPKLIEINTNAGGAFLNALLAKAQRACCTEVEVAMGRRGRRFRTGCHAHVPARVGAATGPGARGGSQSSMIGPKTNIFIRSFCWPSASSRSMASRR